MGSVKEKYKELSISFTSSVHIPVTIVRTLRHKYLEQEEILFLFIYAVVGLYEQ